MNIYSSIGTMIKWFIKCRNKTIKETAREMGIKYTTFSAQLNNNTMTAETLFRLASYLDIDMNWMMIVLGYQGPVSSMDRELVPRMGSEFREVEKKHVLKRLDVLIKENLNRTTDIKRELLKDFSGNMYYLLDVLVSEEYDFYMRSERGKMKYYVDIPQQPVKCSNFMSMRRKNLNSLTEGSKALDIEIENRKDCL